MFGHVASAMFSISRSLTLMLPDVPGFIFTFSSSGSHPRSSSGSRCTPNAFCAFAVSLIKRFDRIVARVALVVLRLKIGILLCCVLSLELLRSWPHFLSVGRSSFLLGSLVRFDSVGAVETGTVLSHLLIYITIDVGVVNDALVHVRHIGVVTEIVSNPAPAPVTVAGVAIAVINSSVKTDMRSPVTLVKYVSTIVPAPPCRCPKQTDTWRSNPGAWHPIIIVLIAPVAGSPNIAFDRTRRLLHDRQNGRSKIDRYVYLGERRSQR